MSGRMNHQQDVLNLSEAARCLGLAQAGGDAYALVYWESRVAAAEAALSAHPRQDAWKSPFGSCVCEGANECPGCNPNVAIELARTISADEERRKHPPCWECGATTAKDAETMCHCSGDKDDCHGCALWPDGDTAPASATVGVDANARHLLAHEYCAKLGTERGAKILSGPWTMEEDAALRAISFALAQQPGSPASVGPMDWSAPPMIWLQVDTSGDNEDRSQPIPADCVGEMSWCHESIGGQEVRYIREDLVVQPRLHSSEAFDLLVAVARAAHAAMDDAETGSDHRTVLEPAAAQVLSDALDALDELPEIPDPDRVYDGWARAGYFALQARQDDEVAARNAAPEQPHG